MMKTKITIPAALLLLPVTLLAQTAGEHPNIGRGFSADKIYQFGEVDAINTFTDALTLTIPLGGTYPVNGNLSYGLTLTYNHQLWKFSSHQEQVNGQTETHTQAFPDPIFNSGFGWHLHLGRLFAPTDTLYNPSQRWVLLTADGSRHSFYPTLHEGEPVTANILYTRDNTYLRLNTETRVIEFPDGTKHTFAPNTFLTRMEDVFGNFVSVSNSCTSSTPTCRWDIADSHGRHHSVNFAGFGFRVTSLDLQAVGGQRAVYTFNYAQQTIHRTCVDGWIGNNANFDPLGLDQLTLDFLQSITGPEGLVWKMETATGALAYYPGIYSGGGTGDTVECMRAGVIHSLILPTKGQLQWTYGLWESPTYRPNIPNIRQDWLSGVLGVAQRTATDPHTGVTGTWTYTSDIFPQPLTPASNQLHSTVTDPEGNTTVTYYSVPTSAIGLPSWTGWEYGLPGVAALGQDGLWKASEIRSATGSVRRRTFVNYTHDLLPGNAGSDGSRFYDTNRRLTKERTVFDDDGGKRIETVYSEFDGLGRFRPALAPK